MPMNAVQPPNPYAPPAAPPQQYGHAVGGATSSVWQQEGAAVTTMNAPWPDRCVRCNAPAEGYRLKRTLYWHPAWIYLLILAGALIYVIVALILRKTATVHVGLCPRHRASRRNWILLGWLGALASIGTCTAVVDQHPEAIGFSVLAVLVLAFVGILKARVVSPKRIDDATVWVRCGRPFVNSLPHANQVWGGYR